MTRNAAYQDFVREQAKHIIGTLQSGEVNSQALAQFREVSLPQIQTVRNPGFAGMALTKKVHRSPAPVGRKGASFDYTPVKRERVERKKYIPVEHVITVNTQQVGALPPLMPNMLQGGGSALGPASKLDPLDYGQQFNRPGVKLIASQAQRNHRHPAATE